MWFSSLVHAGQYNVAMPATLEEILHSHLTGRTVVMGILNVTPDSFSDGGDFLRPEAAVTHARRMVAEGADIIDVGAESTRPGSDGVSAQEQIDRLRPVLPALAVAGACLSIDTTSAAVAEFSLSCGAAIINDVSAGRDDPDMLPLAARRGAAMVLMHMLGSPRVMQRNPTYGDVVGEVKEFLRRRLEAAEAAGIDRKRCIVDPGIGFGKKLEHNLALLAGTGALAELGRPVLVGPSRKRFIGELSGQDSPKGRTSGSVAACLEAWRRGATIFRVHDVGEVVSALAVAKAVANAAPRR